MDFPSIAQKAENIKKKIDSLGYIKSSNFCIVKDAINKLKRQRIGETICIAYNEVTVNVHNMQSVPKSQ